MTDREQSPAAALGRVMAWAGSIWVAFSVLWGLGALQALGLSGPIASALGGTIFPAIILIGVGRAVRRRARSLEESIQPDVSPAPVRTPPILPRTDTSYQPPRPATSTAPKPPRPVVAPEKVADRPIEVAGLDSGVEAAPLPELEPAPSSGGPHKTSQELIEEARQRWGTRP